MKKRNFITSWYIRVFKQIVEQLLIDLYFFLSMKSVLPSQNAYTMVPGTQLLQHCIIGYVCQSYRNFLIDLWVYLCKSLVLCTQIMLLMSLQIP